MMRTLEWAGVHVMLLLLMAAVVCNGGSCGCNKARPVMHDSSLSMMDANVSVSVPVPPYKNWTEEGAVTGVVHQLTCATVEGLHFTETGQLLTLSVQELVDCVEDTDCKNGGCTWHAYFFIVKYRITTQEIYPYTGVKGVCDWEKVGRAAVKIKTFMVVAQDEAQIMEVVARLPVGATIKVSPDFEAYGGGVFRDPCGTKLNHAMTIVGYGETDEGVKYWIIKNSWGADWGEQGYMRLLRGSDMCGIATDVSHPINGYASHADYDFYINNYLSQMFYVIYFYLLMSS